MRTIPKVLPDSTSDDKQFWDRMESNDPTMDSPGMSCSELLPNSASIEVIVATEAGKPLVHFSHRPIESEATEPMRSPQELVSLCAAFVAFRHATHSQVRCITTGSGLVLSGSYGGLHVVVTSSDRLTPFRLLLSLATVAVTSLYFLLSSGFSAALQKRPTIDLGSRAAEVQRHTAQFLKRTVLFPLPAALSAIVSLPCSSAPYTRKRLAAILTSALRSHPSITHLLVLSAAPPFPHQVISSVQPVHHKLSPTDYFMVSSMLPFNTKDELKLPARLFLQSHSFNKASILFVKLVELRLGSSDFEVFKANVGGEQWRPEWNGSGANSVWIVAIGDVTVLPEPELHTSAEQVLVFVENKLDRTRMARDMMVWMERPWRVKDIFLPPGALSVQVRGVIIFGNNRAIGTVGAFHYVHSIELLRFERDRQLLDEWMQCLGGNPKTQNSLFARCPNRDLSMFVDDKKIIFLSGIVSEEQAYEICNKYIIPWLLRNASSLLSSQSYISLPPKTPLSFLLSPFES